MNFEEGPPSDLAFVAEATSAKEAAYREGGVAEWFKATVLKTVVRKGLVGSNPTPSAILRQGYGVALKPSAQDHGVAPGLWRRIGNEVSWSSVALREGDLSAS